MDTVRIKDLPKHVGQKVTVNGWLYNKRTSGKLQFPIVRDGSGYLQCVVSKKEVSEESWGNADQAGQEASVRVTCISTPPGAPPSATTLPVTRTEAPGHAW